MDLLLKEQWALALESGDYIQGNGHLRCEEEEGVETFCCLGVLQDIIDSEAWINVKSNNVNSWGVYHCYLCIGKCCCENDYKEIEDKDLSPGFMAEFDLDVEDASTLIGLNDGKRNFNAINGEPYISEPQSFKAIAIWIRKNL